MSPWVHGLNPSLVTVGPITLSKDVIITIYTKSVLWMLMPCFMAPVPPAAIELITYTVGCCSSTVQYCKVLLIDGLVRDGGVSSVVAMEMLRYCAKPSICNYKN